MNKAEAIEAMKRGEKVTHEYFMSHEWVTMRNGVVISEDGVMSSFNWFWSIRTGEYWDNGWSIWTSNNN